MAETVTVDVQHLTVMQSSEWSIDQRFMSMGEGVFVRGGTQGKYSREQLRMIRSCFFVHRSVATSHKHLHLLTMKISTFP